MNLNMRRFLFLLPLLFLGLASGGQAKDWPVQPVKLVLPYPPGGASDITARLLADKLGTMWKVPVVVENRPGANGIIANEQVATAAPDGYSVLMANLGPNAINHAVYAKLPYDSVRDFRPVILTTKVPLVLVTTKDSSFQNMQDLLAQAREKPGQMAYGSAGVGAGSHMAGELLAASAGVKLLHVPYKGDAPAISDLMGKQIAFALPTAIAASAHLKGGKLKALAVTSETRLPSLPDVPTLAEALNLREWSAVSWGGFMVPRQTPDAVVAKLNADIGKVLSDAEIRAKLQEQGAIVVGGTPEEFAAFLNAELKKWKEVAERGKIRLE